MCFLLMAGLRHADASSCVTYSCRGRALQAAGIFGHDLLPICTFGHFMASSEGSHRSEMAGKEAIFGHDMLPTVVKKRSGGH